jgi:5-methylcytosine-specific restriction endonuclease McrA
MPNGRWATSNRKDRLPADWQARRTEVFRIYGDVCHWCGEPGADEVDHVHAGDDHRIENLRPIHSQRTVQRCHVFKSSAEGGRAAQARMPKRARPAEAHPGLRR